MKKLWVHVSRDEKLDGWESWESRLDPEEGQPRVWMARKHGPKCQAAVLCRQAGLPDKWRPCQNYTSDEQEGLCVRHGGPKVIRAAPEEIMRRRLEIIKARAKAEADRHLRTVDVIEAAMPAFKNER